MLKSFKNLKLSGSRRSRSFSRGVSSPPAAAKCVRTNSRILHSSIRPIGLTQSKQMNRRTLSERSESKGYKIMPWYVYIAEARTGYYYTGITTNPKTRILKHNRDKGSQMGKQHGSFLLLYISSPFPNKSEARKREVQIKGWTREKKGKLISGEWI